MALLSILLFSVRPRDRMMRMLFVHPCIVIMGCCLSYTLIVLVLKYFLFLDGFVRFEFYPLGLLS